MSSSNRKFTKKLTKEQLAEKIVDVVLKHRDFDIENADCKNKPDPNDPIDFIKKCEYPISHIIKDLTPTVSKDLSKVQFDTENIEFRDDKYNKIGFFTLRNELTVLIVRAGGDWETPIFFTIYFDGSNLRAYIPTDGNLWNTTTKEAYGNDDEADQINIKKRFNIDLESLDSLDYDMVAIEQDIMNRIKYEDKQ